MFSNVSTLQRNRDGKIFLDRDGHTFQLLVNYLRGGRFDFPIFESENEKNLFLRELVFWELVEDAEQLER